MQAVKYYENGDASKLVLESEPIPAVSAKDVLVKITVAGINPIDTMVMAGYLKGNWSMPLPFIPGNTTALSLPLLYTNLYYLLSLRL